MWKNCYQRAPLHQIQFDDEETAQDETINMIQEKDEETPTSNWFTKLSLQFLILKKFFPYLWPNGKWDIKLRIIISFIFLFASKGVGLAVPFCYKAAVDQLTIKNAKLSIPWISILLFGLGKLIGNALSNLVDSTFLPVTQNALKEISVETFQHLYELPLEFHLKKKTGGLLKIIDKGTSSMSKLCEFFLINLLPLIVEFILVISVFISKFIFWTTLIIFFDVIIYIVFIIVVMEWRTKMKRERNKSEKEANEKAVDGLMNFETVRNFIGEEHEQLRYSDALQNYMNLAIKAQSSISFLSVGKAAIIAFGQTSVLIIAAYELTIGEISIGDFVLVNTFMSQLFTPLKSLGGSYKLIKESIVDIELLYELLDEKSTVTDVQDVIDFEPKDSEIEFKNVSFSYDKEIPILKNISFKVPSGKQLAIVGSSGGGKSTISKLLFRHYDIEGEGEITIGGINISKVKQKKLRSFIGIVPQDSSLFNDSILYNIMYGSFNATQDDVIEACKIAKIYDFIQTLPDGWNTIVGERGLRLSGGEKQRTIIARAVLKRTPIMLFDEATSSLDTHTEREIQENIRSIFKGKKTSIILAHRLSTIVDSDEIIVNYF
eukprot:gene2663-3859_t